MNFRSAVVTAVALFVISFIFSSCGHSSADLETQAVPTLVTEAPVVDTDVQPKRKYSDTAVTVEVRNDPAEFGIDRDAV